MNAERKRFLRGSLANQLESVPSTEGVDRFARAKWLGEQIENYIERWLGFLASLGTSPLVGDDDLFGMIEVGAELMGEELERAAASTGTQASWCKFLAALDSVRFKGGSVHPEELREAIAGVRAGLTGRD